MEVAEELSARSVQMGRPGVFSVRAQASRGYRDKRLLGFCEGLADGAGQPGGGATVSPNGTGFAVGEITGVAKKAWEYMWVRYADAEDATAKAVVKKLVAVYIEKVQGSNTGRKSG